MAETTPAESTIKESECNAASDRTFEITVQTEATGNEIEVIDLVAESKPDAHRVAKQREDVVGVMEGCTVEYEHDESGRRTY